MPSCSKSWFPNVHYVFLRRLDKTRQAISFHRALRSGTWWSLADDQPQPNRLGADDLGHVDRLHCQLIDQERAWRGFLGASSRPRLELTYEDLARRPREVTASVLRFLGLDASHAKRLPTPRLRRQADRSTSRALFNYWVERRSGAFRSVAATADDVTQALMRTDIIVVDNFFEDPAALRDYALHQSFYYPYGLVPHADGTRRPIWMASRFKRAEDCPLKSSKELIARLEEITDEQIDLEFWRADFPTDREGMPTADHRLVGQRGSLWNCCFHCKPDTNEQLGTGIHNHVVDTWNAVGPHGWSGVVYVNDNARASVSSGLKLWRNRDPGRNGDWMTPSGQWDLVNSIGNISNRLILYRGNLPHSGSPGWGDGLASGRLCLTLYFKTLDPLRRKPVTLEI